MPTVTAIGVELAYEQRGNGHAVLLIHDLAADARTFEPALEVIGQHAQAIAYDRRGYGDSTAPDVYERTTVPEQGEDAAALLRKLGVQRAHICGDGFGALIALDLLMRHPDLVAGVLLSNPPLFAFVPTATEALAKQHEALRRAIAQGGPEAAVDAWLGGRVEGAALQRARAAHRAFFADYAGLATLALTRAQLRAIAVPAIVLTGFDSPPAIVAAADMIAELIPGARRFKEGDFVAAALGLLGEVR
jgi:pimeloyl-ACP methyl ester carboxylesterase